MAAPDYTTTTNGTFTVAVAAGTVGRALHVVKLPAGMRLIAGVAPRALRG